VLADDPPAPQLVQGPHERSLSVLARVRQHVRGELAAHGRRHPGQLPRGVRQPVQARLDHALDPRAQRHLLVAGPAGAQGLHEEERVALRPVVHPRRGALGQGLARQALGQQRRLLGREPAELDLHAAAERPQTGGELPDRVGVVELLGACGGGHEQPRVRRAADEVVHEPQRLGVGPVQVVGHQEQRRRGSEDRGNQGVEQPQAPLPVRGPLGRRRPGLWQHTSQLGQATAVQPGAARGQRPRPQPGRHRGVGQRALGRKSPRLGGEGALARAPSPQLLREPRLPDARLTGDEHELRAPARGGVPELCQARALGLAPDQQPVAGRLDRRRGSGRARALARQQRLVGGARQRRRRDAQLALERRGTGVEHPQRAGPLAPRVVELHEQPVGVLTQRVLAHEALGMADGLGVLIPPGQQLRQARERVEVTITQALALGQQPVVVAAGQQIARVRVDRGAQPGDWVLLGPGERLVERGHVQPERRVRAPPQRPRAHVEVAIGVRQRMAQPVQHVAQVRAGLRLGGVRPQQESEALARLGRVAVQQQVGEERLGARGLERRHWAVAEAQLQLAQQTDRECRAGVPPRSRGALWGPHRGSSVRVRGGRRQPAQRPSRRSSRRSSCCFSRCSRRSVRSFSMRSRSARAGGRPARARPRPGRH
jgi:hypothetical protein